MSYATTTEATEYIRSRYMSTDSLRENWEALSLADQQVLLNKGQDIIDNLPLTGRKANVLQPHAFPRRQDTSTEIPLEVKAAEIELALIYSDSETIAAMNEYKRMIDYGISSYSIGKYSESLLSYSKGGLQLQYGLISQQAERLLSPWMSGGFCVE